MKTLSLLRAGFGVAVLLVAIIAGIAIRHDVLSVETQALQEAQSLAKVLHLLIVRHVGDRAGAPFADRHAELQNDLVALHRLSGRDIVIVDRNKVILADVVEVEIGTTYGADAHDEVARTIADGTPRTFMETSPAYPQGIKELVMPLQIGNATSAP